MPDGSRPVPYGIFLLLHFRYQLCNQLIAITFMQPKKGMSKKNKKKSEGPGMGRQVYTGKLEVTRSGMGFVIVPDQEQDILVKRENMLHALNGDEVKVEVRGHRDNNRRPEG